MANILSLNLNNVVFNVRCIGLDQKQLSNFTH